MATKVADRVVLDTNVLLAATDESRRDHPSALAALEMWPARGTSLYTTGQILREYLVVATRPVERNGLGLTRDDALTNVGVLRSRLQLLEENRRVVDRLIDLARAVDCTGKRIHDINIVAAAVAHGIGAIATANLSDFERFRDYVSIIDFRS